MLLFIENKRESENRLFMRIVLPLWQSSRNKEIYEINHISFHFPSVKKRVSNQRITNHVFIVFCCFWFAVAFSFLSMKLEAEYLSTSNLFKVVICFEFIQVGTTCEYEKLESLRLSS